MQLAALVCENGLGHFKRLVGILAEWHRRNPDDIIHLYAENWQRERLAAWPPLGLLEIENVFFHAGRIAPGVRLLNTETYRDGRLLNWVERLRNERPIQEADLVISDNLSGILSLRSDAVLVGSFLWSDVLEAGAGSMPEVEAFIREERALLEKYNPPMLCVGDIAMPGVQERTRTVPLPWFAQAKTIERTSTIFGGKIAFLGGATGRLDELIQHLANASAAANHYTLYLPPHLIKDTGLSAKPFGFELADFAAVDLVICRPGIGTITDCITSQTPMITLPEPDNPEMVHNARRLEKMGLARAVQDPKDLEKTIKNVTSPEKYQEMVNRFRKVDTSGIRVAVDWLENYSHSKR